MKLTPLEKFILDNQSKSFEQIATELNRSVRSIERAYDRAMRKQRLTIL